jgi:vacuolar-type H+-ATPase subunit H
MPALSQWLERMRRVRLPPGAAAGIVAVPSAGDELSREVAFTFAQLDEIDAGRELALREARAEAARLEASAASERRWILEEAQVEAERAEAQILAARRASCQEQVESILVEADREAERVLACGRERTPRFVNEIVVRMLEDAG